MRPIEGRPVRRSLGARCAALRLLGVRERPLAGAAPAAASQTTAEPANQSRPIPADEREDVRARARPCDCSAALQRQSCVGHRAPMCRWRCTRETPVNDPRRQAAAASWIAAISLRTCRRAARTHTGRSLAHRRVGDGAVGWTRRPGSQPGWAGDQVGVVPSREGDRVPTATVVTVGSKSSMLDVRAGSSRGGRISSVEARGSGEAAGPVMVRGRERWTATGGPAAGIARPG